MANEKDSLTINMNNSCDVKPYTNTHCSRTTNTPDVQLFLNTIFGVKSHEVIKKLTVKKDGDNCFVFDAEIYHKKD